MTDSTSSMADSGEDFDAYSGPVYRGILFNCLFMFVLGILLWSEWMLPNVFKIGVFIGFLIFFAGWTMTFVKMTSDAAMLAA